MEKKHEDQSEAIPPYLERLQRSRIAYEAHEKSRGAAIGAAWAKSSAEYEQLQRIATDGPHDDPALLFEQLDDRHVWKELFDQRDPSSALVEGFIQSAIDVFEEFEKFTELMA